MNCLKCEELITDDNKVVKPHGVLKICRDCFNTIPVDTKTKNTKLTIDKRTNARVLKHIFIPCDCMNIEFVIDRSENKRYNATCNKCESLWLSYDNKKSLINNIMRLGIRFEENK